MTMVRRVLHAGCGNSPLPPEFMADVEVRLDIDQQHNPDVVASMCDIGDIGPFGAVFTSHSLEHLNWLDAMQALREFKRVLLPGGKLVVVVPDIEGIAPDDTVVYISPSGPITGRDMIYGYQACVREFPHMAHRCGFTLGSLRKALEDTGFDEVDVGRHGNDLIAMGVAP